MKCRPVGTKLILGGGCERSELKWGSGGFPPVGKFFKTTPFLSLETPFLYKLHNSNDVEMTLFRCLIDNEHYLQNFLNLEN